MIAQNGAAGVVLAWCSYGPASYAISSKFVSHPLDDPTVTAAQAAGHAVVIVTSWLGATAVDFEGLPEQLNVTVLVVVPPLNALMLASRRGVMNLKDADTTEEVNEMLFVVN